MPPCSVHAGIHAPCPVHAGIVMATTADGTHPTGMHSCFMTFSTVPSGPPPQADTPPLGRHAPLPSAC